MRISTALILWFSSILVVANPSDDECKCTPDSPCWPSETEWCSFNATLSGALIHSVPPASVCYPSRPNYNEQQCEAIRSRWFDSTWHAESPVSIDYPIWANHSCDPIYPNGTSVTGDVNAGKRGCSIGNYPVYVVNATTSEHVEKALVWAGKRNIRVVVKNTGHSYSGRSIGYGSLSIWTHNFCGIEYIEAFKPKSCPISGTLEAVRIAAGHNGYQVQSELAKRSKIIVTGANPSVGLLGWITGGGHGPLTSKYGMGADNLLEATIVTPSGKVLVANPCKNTDIFFAIRGGGGGTYGIVLQVVVKTFSSPRTLLHILRIGTLDLNATSKFWDLMGFLHKEMQRLKEGGMQGYYYIVGPPIYPKLAFYWLFLLADKPNGTAESLVEPIEARLKQQASIFSYEQNTTTVDNFFDLWGRLFQNEDVANGGAAMGSRLLSPRSLSDANKTAKVLKEIGPTMVGPKNGPFDNPSLLGHLTASPDNPSYYPEVISMNPAWRNTLTHFVPILTWRDGMPRNLIDTVYHNITFSKTQPLRDMSPETGAYFNECDAHEPAWQEAFWGKNYARLKTIKEKLDPNNVLWCRRCVGSEALEERGDGRLCRPRHYKRLHPHTDSD